MAVELPSSEAEVQALLESAVSSRASHIRRESQTITMANVRRLLEGDLGLETSALDVHKGFIRKLVDQVLLSSDDAEAQEEEDDEQEERKSEDADAEEDQEKEEEQEDDDVPSSSTKKSSIKKAENGLEEEDFKDMYMKAPKKKKKEKKRKPKDEEDQDGTESPQDDVRVEAPKKKQRKEKEVGRSKGSEDEEGSNGVMSEEESDISQGKEAKKVSSKNSSVKLVQNKKIEHLKKIIKACGLGVPPHIYKRAKQQPENKQDKFLLKELEEILSRRGLSSNPSDKEVKAVKQKIAREKDLEGIDTTNIILEPRGRRAASQLFTPVYKPPPPPEYDSEEGDEDEEESEAGGSESGSEDERKDLGGAMEDTEDSE